VNLIVTGPSTIHGKINLSGSKHDSLAIVAVSSILGSKIQLTNVPMISDIDILVKILLKLGVEVEKNGNTLTIDGRNVQNHKIPHSLTSKLRNSIVFYPALLARFGSVRMGLPGGCVIGDRTINGHERIISQFGGKTKQKGNEIIASIGDYAPKEITITNQINTGPTKTAIIFGMLAHGKTIIHTPCFAPEMKTFIDFLKKGGARIEESPKKLIIHGPTNFKNFIYKIPFDRIECATWISLAAATRGELTINNPPTTVLQSELAAFRKMGVRIKLGEKSMHVSARQLKPVTLSFDPYPGIYSDLQPIIMIPLLTIKGKSHIIENTWSNRFQHVQELKKMGADLSVSGRIVTIKGGSKLHGARVNTHNLRAGMAMVLAGAVANGKTSIAHSEVISRGYENFTSKLKSIGLAIGYDKED
jgi:UDP-N-acetylglucosamine 1-carboxyvinyltransferase